jgi:16S rRNA G527 N7-methylase RsmG
MDSRVLEGVMEAGLKELGIPFEEDTLSLFRRYYTLLEEKNRRVVLLTPML